jgi:acyl-CoA synthetase (AMP-forming)/AMP-acid ligase II
MELFYFTYGPIVMLLSGILIQAANSKRHKQNLLTDGILSCSYQDIPVIFDGFQSYFLEQGISKEDYLALECQNSLLSALLLLYLLEGGYSFLLLPKVVNGVQDWKPPLAGFYRWVVAGRLTDDLSDIDLRYPKQFLTVVNNEGWSGVLQRANPVNPKVYLRTSGSTGVPKIVVHTHAKLWRNALSCVNRLGLEGGDRIAIPVPITHMYGLGAAFLPAVAIGASIDLQKSANLLRYLQREKDFMPNISFMTPGFLETLLKARNSQKDYKLTIVAGDRIKQETFLNYQSRFGCIVQLYGSTEMGAIAAASPHDPSDVRSQTVGKPMPGVQMRVEKGTGESLEGMEGVGELYCQHEYGFEGYVDDNGYSILQNNQDDWFRTKDFGRVWADGHLEVLGRCDHSVNRDGLLVFFSEVEKAIESIEGIDSVVVVSKGESQRGRGLVAYCVLAQATEMTEEDIRSACFQRLLRRAVPDKVCVVKSLLSLPNGKIDRQKLISMDDVVNSSKSIQ